MNEIAKKPADTRRDPAQGNCSGAGIAIGSAYVYSKEVPVVEMKDIDPSEVEGEIGRLRSAIVRSEKRASEDPPVCRTETRAGSARIFEAQIMILNDLILMEAVEKRILGEVKNAEFIVFDEIGKYRRRMLESADEYMVERAHDVEDVMNRIIRNIRDQKLYSRLEGESIIVSETLTPADTVIFSRNGPRLRDRPWRHQFARRPFLTVAQDPGRRGPPQRDTTSPKRIQLRSTATPAVCPSGRRLKRSTGSKQQPPDSGLSKSNWSDLQNFRPKRLTIGASNFRRILNSRTNCNLRRIQGSAGIGNSARRDN